MTTTTPQPPILELARKQLSHVEIKDAAKGDVSALRTWPDCVTM